MKDYVKKIIGQVLPHFPLLDGDVTDVTYVIERPKVREHGHLSTNVALILSKRLKKKPQELAQEIIRIIGEKSLDDKHWIASMSVAGPGFINFTLSPEAWQSALHRPFAEGNDFGKSRTHWGKKVVLEYVSANPTGPLHIGNTRGGPLGDVIASLLEWTGYTVTREYYLNDVGGQIIKLGESLLYWLENKFDPEAPPPEGYQGEYVKELDRLAQGIYDKPKFTDQSSDAAARRVLLIMELGEFGIQHLTEEIKKDCADLGIRFDTWVTERDILDNETPAILQELIAKGVTKKHEGALWFVPKQSDQHTADEDALKDRESVLERSDGRPTYFANDIAYHVQKYRRGYDLLINIWGSNHHGHVPRVQAGVQSLGFDPEKIQTVLYQYVRVKRGAEAVKMSKRGGNFVTAREVIDEVSKDAIRFFLLLRAPESHLDFDLELAKKESQENPVYYVQYGHARLCSILNKAKEQGFSVPDKNIDLTSLNLPEELEMMQLISEFPEEIARAAEEKAPHRICFYLMELVQRFQSYYTKAKEDPRYRVLGGSGTHVDTVPAKLYFCASLQKTIFQALSLLGITAPEYMSHESQIGGVP